MTDFSLRHLVRDVLATSTSTDLGDLAAEVLRRIPVRCNRTALEQALRQYVRQVSAEGRSGSPEPAEKQDFVPSSKVIGVREGWRKHLRDRIHVGGSIYKFHGKLTREDVQFAAAERRTLARQNDAAAERFEKEDAAMAEHGAATLDQLPDDVLQELLS